MALHNLEVDDSELAPVIRHIIAQGATATVHKDLFAQHGLDVNQVAKEAGVVGILGEDGYYSFDVAN